MKKALIIALTAYSSVILTNNTTESGLDESYVLVSKDAIKQQQQLEEQQRIIESLPIYQEIKKIYDNLVTNLKTYYEKRKKHFEHQIKATEKNALAFPQLGQIYIARISHLKNLLKGLNTLYQNQLTDAEKWFQESIEKIQLLQQQMPPSKRWLSWSWWGKKEEPAQNEQIEKKLGLFMQEAEQINTQIRETFAEEPKQNIEEKDNSTTSVSQPVQQNEQTPPAQRRWFGWW